ncbi:MAG: hydantoinase/oxoprolinase family protein [Gammaproteobacteria bacterium]|jgi:N-methylhydantoinase A|nr:hydantoinase/oxoprolinase family protein [Gammaproteobacteria bacterium]
MGTLVNIDNGGTLTDICVLRENIFYKTKTLTTPYDLSKCFFDGLRAVSEVVYGKEDVAKLLAEVDHIRYSTTQGTNAIVERKGPKLGLIVNSDNSELIKRMRVHDEELFDFLVGERIAEINLDDLNDADKAAETATVITGLTSSGANRIVVCFDTGDSSKFESLFKAIALDTYPRHLLGAVPMLFASELVDDISADRRAWTALTNSFLHPAMESFLYNAENRLREYRTKNPLLIFRNDGNASRVAKTIALKTYSSGPRGGMEGVKNFSKQYSLSNVMTMDVGGTTTDIGHLVDQILNEERRGKVEGVPISFGLCDIHSEGVGGSSVLSVKDGTIQVGPESVGAVPGPASFGRGGKSSTITDVNLLLGLLDPSTYFGGGLKLDIDRGRAAIDESIASPLGISVDEALHKLVASYEQKIADGLKGFGDVTQDTVLLAFGGAGPMNACGVAELAGINTVYVPKMAAVFSAFGIGSCDIGQSYAVVLSDRNLDSLKSAYSDLIARAERDMFAEGYAKGDFEISAELVSESDSKETIYPLNGNLALLKGLEKADSITLEVRASKRLKTDDDKQVKTSKGKAATASGMRAIVGRDLKSHDLSVYSVNEMKAGAHAAGPAVIEEEFFTCLVREGWKFVVTDSGDICLTKGVK